MPIFTATPVLETGREIHKAHAGLSESTKENGHAKHKPARRGCAATKQKPHHRCNTDSAIMLAIWRTATMQVRKCAQAHIAAEVWGAPALARHWPDTGPP